MRRFEKVGLTRAQAEQVTELLTETICMNKVKITEQFVSKAALEKVTLTLLLTAHLFAPAAAFRSLALKVTPWDVLTALDIVSSCARCSTQAILEQESRIAGFKGEVAKSQELHLASLSRDTERLTNSLEKMRAEIK